MSSLPPVFIELKASISEFQARFKDAERSVTDLEGTTGGVVGKMKTHMGSITTAAGAGMAGLGGFLTEASSKMATANSDLESAVSAAGGNMDDLAGKVASVDSKMEHFGHSSADTNEALAKLTVATGDPNKALSDMSVTAEIAAAKHTSLTDAAGMVAKVVAGNTKSLKAFGITGDDVNKTVEASHGKLTKADAALKLVQDRLGKTAENQAKTFHGKMGEIKTRVGDMVAQFGEKFGPALMGVGAAMGALGPVISGISAAFSFLGANPIVLVIVAIAALALGLYEAYQHCSAFREIVDTVFNAVKTVVLAVWNDFVKPVFDAYKLVIGTEIGAALTVLQTAFDTVWGVIKSVVSSAWNDVIQPIFNLYKTVIGTEIGAALTILQTAFDTAWGAIRTVVSAAWNDVIKPIFDAYKLVIGTEIGGALDVLKTAWDTVWGGIKTTITDIWNDGIKPVFDAIKVVIGGGVDGIGAAIDTVKNTWGEAWDDMHTVLDTIWNSFLKPIFDTIKQGIEDVVGPLEKVVGFAGKLASGVGGAASAVGGFLGFQEGGVVPGPIGAPVLAVIHGGETVVPPGSLLVTGPGGGVTIGDVAIHVYGVTDPDKVADVVRTKLLQLGRRNVSIGLG